MEEGIDGELVDLISKDPWHYSTREERDAWMSKVRMLATELVLQPAALERSLRWLGSEEASSTQVLGNALGEVDEEARVLDLVIKDSVDRQNVRLAAGYIETLLDNHPEHTASFSDWLNQIAENHADLASDLVAVAGELMRPVEWTAVQVKRGLVRPEKLTRFLSWVGKRHATSKEIHQILDLLVDESLGQNGTLLRAVIRGLTYIDRGYDPELRHELVTDSHIRGQVKCVLNAAIRSKTPQHGWEWERIARLFYADEPRQMIDLCIAALLSDNFDLDSRAAKILSELASSETRFILERLQAAESSEESSWRFQLGVYRSFVGALDIEELRIWLNETGPQGAQLIARHLPTPFVDDSGQGIVPEITEYVLGKFGDDETVMSRFIAGSHSFKTFWGSAADMHEQAAATASVFLDHENPSIRKWAALEVRSNRASAKHWAEEEAEDNIES